MDPLTLFLLLLFSHDGVLGQLSQEGTSRGNASEASSEEDDFLQNVDISEEEIIAQAENNHYKINDSFIGHKYYKSQFRLTDDFWVDLNELNETHKGIVHENSLLANSYRQAATITLSFKFPFYGHEIDNITIATGGFLYTGDHVHSWLAATHYIAPLMANFDLRRGNAEIMYADNGTAFIVEWKEVYLNKTSTDEGGGPFSFQATIHKNGDIVFAYKNIALNISRIQDKAHPVKVGLSDAYTIDKALLYIRRKTIYEYHRVNLLNASIVNSSAIILRSLPTCNLQKECKSCIKFNNQSSEDNELNFKCTWCPSLGRCSDGMDRELQSWMDKLCHKTNVSDLASCDAPPPVTTVYSKVNYNSDQYNHNRLLGSFVGSEGPAESNNDSYSSSSRKESSLQSDVSHIVRADLVVIILVCLIVFLVTMWFAYAYVYPHTWSGQLLIKYRPTRWHWGRNEPRYTAASIHM